MVAQSSFGGAGFDGWAGYLRISFLPKRPESRRETERPMMCGWWKGVEEW